MVSEVQSRVQAIQGPLACDTAVPAHCQLATQSLEGRSEGHHQYRLPRITTMTLPALPMISHIQRIINTDQHCPETL
jgi:hypothetical protein